MFRQNRAGCIAIEPVALGHIGEGGPKCFDSSKCNADGYLRGGHGEGIGAVSVKDSNRNAPSAAVFDGDAAGGIYFNVFTLYFFPLSSILPSQHVFLYKKDQVEKRITQGKDVEEEEVPLHLFFCAILTTGVVYGTIINLVRTGGTSRMEYDWYFWGAILAVISIILVIFCIIRGKGTSHKILIFFTSLLCVVAMVCFGGEVVLNHFGMGWRCTPFNTMVGLCFVLFIPILLCNIWQLIHLEGRNHTLIGCGVISMLLALVVIPMCSFFYFFDTSLSDAFTEYDGQTIVYASNGHGSYGSVWRYYIPINDLVHGTEITQDGWHGVRPWDHTS